jgi:hypothetical protein
MSVKEPAANEKDSPNKEPSSGTRRLEILVANFVAGRWFLPLAAVVLLALLTTITLPPPSTRFTLTVQTRSFTVGADGKGATLQSVSANGDLGILLAAQSSISLAGIFTNLPEALSPNGPLPQDPEGYVTITEASGKLQEVRLLSHGRLRVEAISADTLSYFGPSGVGLSLMISGNVTAAPPPVEVPRAIPPPPQRIDVGAGPTDPVRAVLKLPGGSAEPQDIGVEDLPVRFLGFSRPRHTSDDRIPFRSDVIAGTLRLEDVRRDVALRPGDPIHFGCWVAPTLLRWIGLEDLNRWWRGSDCFIAHLARARLEAGKLVVEVVGNAERIAVGPRDALTEATPSLLAYLLGQEGTKLLWGAVLALLGGLWKVHGWARNALKP